jgi:hypothetical protein
MDTSTKIIVAVLIAVLSACALLAWTVGHSMELALVFTGLATSGATGLFALLYGMRSQSVVYTPGISIPEVQTPPAPQTPPATPPA